MSYYRRRLVPLGKPMLRYVEVYRKPIKLPEEKKEEKREEKPKPPQPQQQPQQPKSTAKPEKRLVVKGAGVHVVGEGPVEYVTPEGVVEYQSATEYVNISVEPTDTSIVVRLEHFIVDDQGRKKTVEEKEILLERVL